MTGFVAVEVPAGAGTTGWVPASTVILSEAKNLGWLGGSCVTAGEGFRFFTAFRMTVMGWVEDDS